VLLRELAEVAEVIPLGTVAELDGHLSLIMQCNQNDGHVIVLSPAGTRLGEFELPANDYPDVRPAVRLTNVRGNISLESIRVIEITAELTRETSNASDTVRMKDGSVHTGELRLIGTDEWEIETHDDIQRIRPGDVLSIHFARSPSDETPEEETLEGASTEEPSSPSSGMQVTTHDGTRLTGTLESVSDTGLALRIDSFDDSLEIATDQIARFRILEPSPGKRESSEFILGRLHFPDGRLTGGLVDTDRSRSDDANASTPLRFAPRGATPVNLLGSFSGRLVYRETPPPETEKQRQARIQREAAQQKQAARRANQGGVWNALKRAFGNNTHTSRKKAQSPSMHLRSGEIIPCTVEAIDESGVRFSSELTEKTLLPVNELKVIQFAHDGHEPSIDIDRRERLLTLPRVRKRNRPTHLVVATNGDMLRCRMISLSADTLLVESRLEKIEIDRSLVTQIIWLQDEANSADSDQTPPDGAPRPLAVRAVLRNRNRMSMYVERLRASILSGEHPLLGKTQLKLGDVNELLIGIDIRENEPEQPYSLWSLKDAPEPIIPDPGGEPNAGASSALVGKQAPDFELDLLEGGRFSLADQRGQVVVLDFWATWCGPCLQAMPMIEGVVCDFVGVDVRLVAVNLQESSDTIRETLERLKITPEVVLDIDGVAAARYQANAIPQTVVIDRTGVIRRLYVGGGPKLGAQLREAITDALGETLSK
ncbi:MAG: TlpA family protein disulfide reductase, partial [Rhodopirellula sp. JB053]